MLHEADLSWNQISTLIKQALTRINSDIVSSMSNASSSWSSQWNQIVKKTKDACSEIINTISEMNDQVQDMLSSIEHSMSKANSFSSKSRSVSYSAVSPAMVTFMNDVPKLASGSVLRGGNPFLAILGDQPHGQVNVEAPAGLIKDMVKQGLREELSGMDFGSGQIKVAVQVNGADLARVTLNNFLSEMARQGYNVDLLGYT